MGREALLKTCHNFTTQKAVSTNNAFLVTNPKHMSYSRNGANRDHSVIHMKNNNVGYSIMNMWSTPVPKLSRIKSSETAEQVTGLLASVLQVQ